MLLNKRRKFFYPCNFKRVLAALLLLVFLRLHLAALLGIRCPCRSYQLILFRIPLLLLISPLLILLLVLLRGLRMTCKKSQLCYNEKISDKKIATFQVLRWALFPVDATWVLALVLLAASFCPLCFEVVTVRASTLAMTRVSSGLARRIN